MKKKKEQLEQTNSTPVEETTPAEIKVKKSFTIRPYMLVASGITSLLGIGMFAMYFFSLNMAVGGPAIFILGAGIFTFRYYWKKTGDSAVEHIGDVPKEQMNSLCIYYNPPDIFPEIKFENVYEPEGYPWECLNDGCKYYVNIWDKALNRLVPFALPDQQYYDPGVFAERVLGLPAHRRIFTRKPKLFQKLKPALLVLAIGIVWLLIMTTTGGG